MWWEKSINDNSIYMCIFKETRYKIYLQKKEMNIMECNINNKIEKFLTSLNFSTSSMIKS